VLLMMKNLFKVCKYKIFPKISIVDVDGKGTKAVDMFVCL